jgi:hypothetical protein
MNNSPSVIIVGKGTSLLGKELGSVIDAFDIVIRVNHMPTDTNVQKHIGAKTTIFSSIPVRKITEYWNDIVAIKKLWIGKSWEIERNNVKYQGYYKIIDDANKEGVDVKFLSKEEYTHLVEEFSGFGEVFCSSDGEWGLCIPDTGVTTILSAIHRFEGSKICVCGFDFYVDKTNVFDYEYNLRLIGTEPIMKQILYYKKLLYSGKIYEL